MRLLVLLWPADVLNMPGFIVTQQTFVGYKYTLVFCVIPNRSCRPESQMWVCEVKDCPAVYVQAGSIAAANMDT